MRKEISYGIIPVKQVNGKWFLLFVQHLIKDGVEGGHWSFPKGHPEEWELPLETAKRELDEETKLKIVRLLRETPFYEHYQFTHQEEAIDKQVVYFLAEVEGSEEALAGEIAHIEWVSLEEGEKKATFLECQRLCREVGAFLLSDKFLL